MLVGLITGDAFLVVLLWRESVSSFVLAAKQHLDCQVSERVDG